MRKSKQAGAGQDTVKADAGQDTVKADAGQDTVKADAGQDTVKADAGQDTVKNDPAENEGDGETGQAAQDGLDLQNIKRIVEVIDNRPGQTFAAFAHELREKEGAKFRATTEGRSYLRMAGLEAGARGGEADALANWCNKARRMLLQAA